MINHPSIRRDIDISNFSGFRTKAIAKYYFEVNSLLDIPILVEMGRLCEENNIKMLIVGRGTNCLFAFDVFEGLFIKNNLDSWSFDEKTKIVNTLSNTSISSIASSLKENYSLDIWERFIGLPGGVGGAVFGNAGCFGLETGSNFLDLEAVNLSTGQFKVFNKTDVFFSYRSSFFKEGDEKYFIISIRFDLSKVQEKYPSTIDVVKFRKKEQPKGLTCGSFFKNPLKDNSAGKLIEEVGLKGYNLRGAYFSDKHANFLMSDGSATYKDLLDLIDLAIEKVNREKNIILTPEVRIIKN